MNSIQYGIDVTPKSAVETVWKEDRCIYSVSIGAANQTRDDILNGLEWTQSRFPRVAVLVGDSLYAVTLQVQRGHDDGTAQTEAFGIADEIVRMVHERIGALEIIRTSQVASEALFLDVDARLEAAYESVPDFASSIDADANQFVARQHKRNRLALSVDSATALARRYLLREISTYAYLASIGWRVDVYLGRELPTLARIIEGSVPPVSPELAQRINISLTRKDKP